MFGSWTRANPSPAFTGNENRRRQSREIEYRELPPVPVDIEATKEALEDPTIGQKMTRFMLDNGLYFYTQGSRFEIHPCLTITEDEIDEMVSILDRTVGYAEKELGIA